MFEIHNPKLRAKLLPRRGLPGSAVVPTARQRANTLERLEKGYRKIARHVTSGLKKAEELAALEPDLGQLHLQPLREATHALLRAPTEEALAAASPEVLGAALVVGQRADPSRSLVPGIVAAHGLVVALDAYLRCLDFGLHYPGNWRGGFFLVEESGPHGYRWRPDHLPLRHAVCAAPEEEYAAARRRAEELRPALPPLRRARLAAIFPDESWADGDLTELLADTALRPYHVGFLLGAARDPAVVLAFADRFPNARELIGNHALDIAAAMLEGQALPLLTELLGRGLKKPKHGPLLKTPPKQLAAALGCFRSPAAARQLAPFLGHRIVGPTVAETFRAWPELLAEVDPRDLGKAARTAFDTLREGAERAEAASGPVAAAEDVPPLLRERPWRPRKGKKPKPRVLALTLPAKLEEHIDPDFLARDYGEGSAHLPEMGEEQRAAWREKRAKGDFHFADRDWWHKKGAPNVCARVPAAEALVAWNEGADVAGDVRHFLQTHGLAALPGLVRGRWWKFLQWESGPVYLEAALAVDSPRLAPSFARVAARRKNFRAEAAGWFLRHPANAALGLLPDALGADKKARKEAVGALAILLAGGHHQTVRAAAARYGDEALAALAPVLERDPLDVARKPPKAPAFLLVERLPPLLLRSGGALPADAIEALLEMLRTVERLPRYPGLDLVAEAVTPDSLDAWLCALLEQWVLAGAPGRHDWMLHACTQLPAPDAVRRVGELLRGWAQKKKAHAARAAEALAAAGSDQALMHLAHVASTARFDQVKAQVRRLLGEVAAARGLSADALADRTVPALGLEEDGSLPLDFGPRTFVVRLDGALGLRLEDAAGTRQKSFPRSRKSDDKAKLAAARKRYQAFKKDVEAIADRQRRRFERALQSQRTWPAADFERFLVAHPLVRQLCAGLVWEVVDGVRFRVCADGGLADIEDDDFALPADARVRIAHPLSMPDELPTWSERFGDYELVQPFPQLGRETFTPTAKERKAKKLTRHVGGTIEGKKLLGMMESRGWRRDSAGHVGAWLRTVPTPKGPAVLRLPITPGIDLAWLENSPQTPGALESPVPLGKLGPIAFSELVRELAALRG